MRARMATVLAAMVAIVAGCSGAGPRTTSSTVTGDDPLAQPEQPFTTESLPGMIVTAWPLPLARGANGWLLPFSDGGEVHVRFVGDDGSRADRVVDGGTLVGTAALDDGFALAVTSGGSARVHFLAGDGSDDVVTLELGGDAVPGIASDGTRVLIAATTGGDVAAEGPTPLYAGLAIVDRAGAQTIALGSVHAAPAPWGDRQGFIVGGTLLVDGSGDVAPVPGRQVRDARVFRQAQAAGAQPTSDILSLDGDRWRAVGGLVGWAGRTGDGAALELVALDGSRALVEVGDDLTPRSQRALPSTTRGDGGQAWIADVAGTHVVWGATVENDPVFAILDATAMSGDGGFVRLRGATSRTTVVSPGAAGVLLAWTGEGGTVRYTVLGW